MKPSALPKLESVHDVLHHRKHPLDVFFAPRAVAVIGATENPGSVGRTTFWNLITNPFGGTVYPVNPKRAQVLGVKAYANLRDVPRPVDLAVIVTPAATVSRVMEDCADAGVKGVIIISAGFKELGPAGAKLEGEIVAKARAAGIRIVGPNCLGIMSPNSGLNATFASGMARPGSIGFLSQSGALCTAVLDWSFHEMVGFSVFSSIGSMADVGWGDLIDYLGDDPRTRSIIIYMESVGDARAFLSSARQVGLSKPIIVIKAGRSAAAAKAAASHTGSLAGSDEVLDAAFRRTGVLRVQSIGDLFHMADVLGKQSRPTGPRLAILTNAGGPGVLATDALIAAGGELAQIAPTTMESLNAFLPKEWSRNNPIDILNRAGIPTFPFPDTAAKIFHYMWQYSYNLQGLYQTPVLPGEVDGAEMADADAGKIVEQVRKSGRTILTEVESKRLLGAYGIPTVPTEVAATAEEAIALADKFGYPVVLKLYSETITHKTDVGGVRLNLCDPKAVVGAFKQIEKSVNEKAGAGHFQGVAVQPMIRLDGYELIIGSSLDSQFGPVLLFGTGGQLVEVFKDSALALPPLNTTLARRLMEQTRIYKALKGVRGRKPVDLDALEKMMVQFSYLVVEQRWIKEIDINPLIASPERLLALDARVVLHGPEVTEDKLPKLAIRPYPSQYVSAFTMKDGVKATIRPIRPEDEPLMVKFHNLLSERSVKMRYTQAIALSDRVAHERLIRNCFTDFDREIALVADRHDPSTGKSEIMGVGRMTRFSGTSETDFAIVVADPFQQRGLGGELLRRMLEVAKAEKLSRLKGEFLADNSVGRRMCKKMGFRLEEIPDKGLVRAELAVS